MPVNTGLRRAATKTAATMRAHVEDRKRGAPLPRLSGLQVTPLFPADPARLGQLLEMGVIHAIHQTWETFVVGLQDIVPGDTLVMEGFEYHVRAVAWWDAPAGTPSFLALTVEEIHQ